MFFDYCMLYFEYNFVPPLHLLDPVMVHPMGAQVNFLG
jgi:hypothetical protein